MNGGRDPLMNVENAVRPIQRLCGGNEGVRNC